MFTPELPIANGRAGALFGNGGSELWIFQHAGPLRGSGHPYSTSVAVIVIGKWSENPF
jgi:hypothetical protein